MGGRAGGLAGRGLAGGLGGAHEVQRRSRGGAEAYVGVLARRVADVDGVIVVVDAVVKIIVAVVEASLIFV